MQGSSRRSRRSWNWVVCAATIVLVLQAGCTPGVDVTLNLISPCDASGFEALGCQYLQVVVSALDPQDSLHRAPLRTSCEVREGRCKVAGELLLGAGRVVDVLCLPSENGAPVGRATSGSLLFDTSAEGVGGANLNLVMGAINGFIETTVAAPGVTMGECSGLEGERFGHASALLHDGRVLISGGIPRSIAQAEQILASAEIFDPATGVHRPLTDSSGAELLMQAGSGRAYHTATTLRDGRVLIAGGVGLISGGSFGMVKTALRSSEIFDPATATFVATRDMGTGRAHHSATLLANGEVLISGGVAYSSGGEIEINGCLDSAVLYEPNGDTWRPARTAMATARAFHQAVLLDPSKFEGKVLVVGGENANGPGNSIDIYNPKTEGFESGVRASMSKSRSHHCAVSLANGEVLVAGGITEANKPPDTGVEVFDPAANEFKRDSMRQMNSARMDHTCSLLDDGNVLIAGGLTGGDQATSAGDLVLAGQSYQVIQLADSIKPPRYLHTATVLRNGWVLLVGGLANKNDATPAISQSVLFVPPPVLDGE